MRIVTRKQLSGRWTATDDDGYEPGSPIGAGRSEAAAIADLMEQIEEKAREVTDALCQDARDHLRKV
jgi:hypothetical protein